MIRHYQHLFLLFDEYLIAFVYGIELISPIIAIFLAVSGCGLERAASFNTTWSVADSTRDAHASHRPVLRRLCVLISRVRDTKQYLWRTKRL